MLTIKLSAPAAEYRHIWYLLFWPVFVLRYILLEQVLIPAQYHVVYCPLDDRIPFLEGFLIPYGMWYFFLVGMHLYTCLRDPQAFRRYSQYMIVAFSISTAIFVLFPNCQQLRPAVFPRENLLTDLVTGLYRMDTNTNVCPSEHVIGSIAFFLAAADAKNLRKPALTAAFAVAAFFTGIATVFLKQHSLVDVLAALPVCLIAYRLCYGKEHRFN